MKIVHIVILSVLVFLAVSSGITKIMLMPQDVEFFGKYGFTNPLLIAFGILQFIGGVMMIFSKARFVGAAIVFVTFAISAGVLLMEGAMPFTIATLVAMVFLGLTMRQSWGGRQS